MASHTFELNENQEQGWQYLFEQVNEQREKNNQLPYSSVEEFMTQTLIDTGNTQFMIKARAVRQKQVDALMNATGLTDETERTAAIDAALAIGRGKG